MDQLVDPCSWRSDSRLALAAYTLLLLRREGRMGRKGLAELLDVGEATGRTVLSKLKSAGLAEADRGGARLTPEGERRAEELGGLVDIAEAELPERYGNRIACLIVKEGCGSLGTGVAHRDEAVKGGADGALILVRRNGKYSFPDWMHDYPLRLTPEAPEGACVVISWAASGALAINGAMRAASSIICSGRGPGRRDAGLA
ncbi:MAG: DUF4443 domain-containing protein [Conexivisphaera sp.]